MINASTDPSSQMTEDFIDTIIDRWRGATMSKQTALDGATDLESLARDEFSTLSPRRRRGPASADHSAPRARAAPRLDPDRFRLLKKPRGKHQPAAPQQRGSAASPATRAAALDPVRSGKILMLLIP